ncbi:MAG TPA: SRPBCC family protein [Planctomycetota bacterium]|nr:SRPBCC family protein [Planctomycetota bacterium]
MPHAEIVIDAPPRALYDVVVDYPSYPKFFPEFKEATVVDTEGSARIVEFTCDYGKTVNYTLRIEHDETKLKTRWTYVGGDLKDSKGGWEFQDAGNGKTKVLYDVDAQVGFFVPKFIVDKLTANNIPKMFEQLKGEVARRAKK